jgi:hypothetical protein
LSASHISEVIDAAHGAGVFARGEDAVVDAARILLVERHEVHDVVGAGLVVARLEVLVQAADRQHGAPLVVRLGDGLLEQRHAVGDVEHARRVLGPLHAAGHPVEVVCGR